VARGKMLGGKGKFLLLSSARKRKESEGKRFFSILMQKVRRKNLIGRKKRRK